jgi:hypothetical protein
MEDYNVRPMSFAVKSRISSDMFLLACTIWYTTPEETSSCHPGGDGDDEEEDETGGTESTESAEQEGEERN